MPVCLVRKLPEEFLWRRNWAMCGQSGVCLSLSIVHTLPIGFLKDIVHMGKWGLSSVRDCLLLYSCDQAMQMCSIFQIRAGYRLFLSAVKITAHTPSQTGMRHSF